MALAQLQGPFICLGSSVGRAPRQEGMSPVRVRPKAQWPRMTMVLVHLTGWRGRLATQRGFILTERIQKNHELSRMGRGNWLFLSLITSILVCRRIVRCPPRNTDTSGDKEYDRLVMSSILPRNPGVTIDKVADALKEQELGSFVLYENKNSLRK